jgi:hypothetical protein
MNAVFDPGPVGSRAMSGDLTEGAQRDTMIAAPVIVDVEKGWP